jgi:hypothetical protein
MVKTDNVLRNREIFTGIRKQTENYEHFRKLNLDGIDNNHSITNCSYPGWFNT